MTGASHCSAGSLSKQSGSVAIVLASCSTGLWLSSFVVDEPQFLG
jgi:hypothetical protein